MVITAPEPRTEWLSIGEQRTILRGLSWSAYVQMLDSLPLTRDSRLLYDEGTLEITVPLENHQFARYAISKFLLELSQLMELKVKKFGPITLNYASLEKGVELDNAYYFPDLPLLRVRAIDFDEIPPPDLVVEVDMTPTNIAKNQFYASLNVPELWRYNGKVWRIYKLQENVYIELEYSPTFPQVPKTQLYAFLERMKKSEREAFAGLRAWWQQQNCP